MIQSLVHEPHKIKTICPVAFPSLEERKRYLAEAHFNVFNLTPSQVGFDMCSLGTSAMTQEQLSGQLIGDEAYAGARNFERLEQAVRRRPGAHVRLPDPQCSGLRQAGRGHHGARLARCCHPMPDPDRRADPAADVEVPDMRDHEAEIFTGNVDLGEASRNPRGGKVAIVGMQAFADGQHPFSMENLRAVRSLADRYGKRLVLDGSRVIENAWYIQRHEPGMGSRSIADPGQGDRQDRSRLPDRRRPGSEVPTGGLLATDNPEDHEHFMNEVVVYEGYTPTAAWRGAPWRSSPAVSRRCASKKRSSG